VRTIESIKSNQSNSERASGYVLSVASESNKLKVTSSRFYNDKSQNRIWRTGTVGIIMIPRGERRTTVFRLHGGWLWLPIAC
jgi:hypothetical protein